MLLALFLVELLLPALGAGPRAAAVPGLVLIIRKALGHDALAEGAELMAAPIHRNVGSGMPPLTGRRHLGGHLGKDPTAVVVQDALVGLRVVGDVARILAGAAAGTEAHYRRFNVGKSLPDGSEFLPVTVILVLKTEGWLKVAQNY